MRIVPFFYDLLACLIPGAGMVLLTFWFFVGFFSVLFPLEMEGSFAFLLFFSLAFFLGHLIQAIARSWERWRKKRRGSDWADRFLNDEDGRYTKPFKTALKKAIQDAFGLTVDVRGTDAVKSARRQEVFFLCYHSILRKGEGTAAEVYRQTGVLLRGLVWVLLAGIGTAALVAGKQAAIWFYRSSGIYLPDDPFFYFDQLQLVLAGGFLALFLLALLPLAARVREFDQRFVDAVYMNFFALFKRPPEA